VGRRNDEAGCRDNKARRRDNKARRRDNKARRRDNKARRRDNKAGCSSTNRAGRRDDKTGCSRRRTTSSDTRTSSTKERAQPCTRKVGIVGVVAIRVGSSVYSAASKLMLYCAFHVAGASSKGNNSARMSHFS
jgi:hypothetical protein